MELPVKQKPCINFNQETIYKESDYVNFSTVSIRGFLISYIIQIINTLKSNCRTFIFPYKLTITYKFEKHIATNLLKVLKKVELKSETFLCKKYVSFTSVQNIQYNINNYQKRFSCYAIL